MSIIDPNRKAWGMIAKVTKANNLSERISPRSVSSRALRRKQRAISRGAIKPRTP